MESNKNDNEIIIEINQKRYAYQSSDVLGRGAFGTVYKAIQVEDQRVVAIKIIEHIEQYQLKEYLKEVNILEKITKQSPVDNEYFVKIIDYQIKEEGSGTCTLLIVLEYCNLGDMQTYLSKNKELDERKAVNIVSQIIYALKVLRKLKIVHRDLKPSNILVHQKGSNVQIKITDFGCSKDMDLSQTFNASVSLGTPLYMSPQVLKMERYTDKADIWSLGILYYQMLFGRTPWPVKSIDHYIEVLDSKIEISFPRNINPITEGSRELIKKCLVVEEKDRINWDNLFQHELIKEKISQLETKKSSTANKSPLRTSKIVLVPDAKTEEKKPNIKIISDEVITNSRDIANINQNENSNLIKEISSISHQNQAQINIVDREHQNKNIKEIEDINNGSQSQPQNSNPKFKILEEIPLENNKQMKIQPLENKKILYFDYIETEFDFVYVTIKQIQQFIYENSNCNYMENLNLNDLGQLRYSLIKKLDPDIDESIKFYKDLLKKPNDNGVNIPETANQNNPPAKGTNPDPNKEKDYSNNALKFLDDMKNRTKNDLDELKKIFNLRDLDIPEIIKHCSQIKSNYANLSENTLKKRIKARSVYQNFMDKLKELENNLDKWDKYIMDRISKNPQSEVAS